MTVKELIKLLKECDDENAAVVFADHVKRGIYGKMVSCKAGNEIGSIVAGSDEDGNFVAIAD